MTSQKGSIRDVDRFQFLLELNSTPKTLTVKKSNSEKIPDIGDSPIELKKRGKSSKPRKSNKAGKKKKLCKLRTKTRDSRSKTPAKRKCRKYSVMDKNLKLSGVVFIRQNSQKSQNEEVLITMGDVQPSEAFS